MIANFFGFPLIKVENHSGKRHPLVVGGSSKYANNLKRLDTVNSYHNYAVQSLSDEWTVSAYSEGGIIEAFEHKRLPIFCQMWHSEREEPLCPDEIQLIRAFFNYSFPT